MTVAELIASLKELPQDIKVAYFDRECGYALVVEKVEIENNYLSHGLLASAEDYVLLGDVKHSGASGVT